MKLPRPNIHTNWKTVSRIVSLVVFTAAIVVATLTLQEWRQPPKLPANAQCLKLANDVKNALEGSQSQIVAVLDNKPKPQVDLSSLKSTYQECVDTQGTTQVMVSK